MNGSRLTQLSFSFGGLFRQDMTAVRLAALKAAVASASKTLGGTAVSFYFWHLFAPIIKNTKSLRYNPTRQNAWP
jgi:hypothetical protein